MLFYSILEPIHTRTEGLCCDSIRFLFILTKEVKRFYALDCFCFIFRNHYLEELALDCR